MWRLESVQSRIHDAQPVAAGRGSFNRPGAWGKHRRRQDYANADTGKPPHRILSSEDLSAAD